jgi:hypothetical protein
MVTYALSKLGLKPNCIVETVVSTYSSDGSPTAAPMGIIFTSRGRAIIKPFKATQTYRNIRNRQQCTVNLTTNPEIFYRAALKGTLAPERLPTQWFEKSNTVDAPRLRGADASLEAVVKKITDLHLGRVKILCKVVGIKLRSTYPRSYCRAPLTVIESIIHATRIIEFVGQGKKAQAMRLLNQIREHRGLTGRVAPNTRYVKIMDSLVEELNAYIQDPNATRHGRFAASRRRR